MKYQIKQIIRTNRKTFTIKILADGNIEIRCPNKTTNKEITALIKKHAKWIENKIELIEKRKLKPKKFTTGEEFLLLGKKIHLAECENYKNIEIKNSKIYLPNTNKEKKRKIIEQLYKKIAKQYFLKQAKHYAINMNVNFNSLKLSSAKTRWGSCSSKQNINITWRLIMAPPEIIDYVIIHELAHLTEMNHSKKFWKIVEQTQPNYKINKKWLKNNGHLLNF